MTRISQAQRMAEAQEYAEKYRIALQGEATSLHKTRMLVNLMDAWAEMDMSDQATVVNVAQHLARQQGNRRDLAEQLHAAETKLKGKQK